MSIAKSSRLHLRRVPESWWRLAARRALRLWQRVFPPAPERIPGTWRRPAPLPFGTVLIEGEFPVVADGKGGFFVGPSSRQRQARASRPRTG